MSQVVKQGVRITGAIAVAAISLVALMLSLQTKLPSQAMFLESHLQSVAASPDMNNGILPENGAYHGAVVPLEQVDAFECMVGKKLKVIKVYQAFKDGDFYQNWADFIHDQGAIEFLSFDPIVAAGNTITGRDLNCCDVLSSNYDVITTFAQHIKSWGQPLMLSFAGEMNGNWAGWSGAYNFGPNCVTYTEVSDLLYTSYGCTDTSQIACADGPERYRDMYRRIYEIFANQGVTNVTWVWVVNHESFPNEKEKAWNQVGNYYPGDEYVDIISIDGYNWGNSGPGGWKSFDQVFSATLTFLSDTYPTKPLMLGEFASVEGTDPISKANWITDAYNHIKSDWPQIKAVLWFDVSGDWRFPVESSPESIRAYREAIADPYFVGDCVWCSYLPLVRKGTFCTNSGKGGTETIRVEPSHAVKGIHIDLIERALQQYGFSLWEVEIYGPGTGNLALGATVTASSWQDGYGCHGCSPDKAIDGNMNTRWGSSFYEPQWFKITLPAPQAVDRIVLKWENAYATKYCVNVLE
jgi:hypothetical protein